LPAPVIQSCLLSRTLFQKDVAEWEAQVEAMNQTQFAHRNGIAQLPRRNGGLKWCTEICHSQPLQSPYRS
jgi:hypothetical protein